MARENAGCHWPPAGHNVTHPSPSPMSRQGQGLQGHTSLHISSFSTVLFFGPKVSQRIRSSAPSLAVGHPVGMCPELCASAHPAYRIFTPLRHGASSAARGLLPSARPAHLRSRGRGTRRPSQPQQEHSFPARPGVGARRHSAHIQRFFRPQRRARSLWRRTLQNVAPAPRSPSPCGFSNRVRDAVSASLKLCAQCATA